VILGDLLVFLIQSPVDFTTLGEMTHAEKEMNSQHFGSDPTDILIWINPDSNPGSAFDLGGVYAV